MTEEQLSKSVIDLAVDLGYMVYSIRRSDLAGLRHPTGKGFPDLTIVGHNRLLLVELKDDKGRPTAAQVSWKRMLIAAGAEWYLWRPAHWQKGGVLRILTGRGHGTEQ